jgi:hypothetical protein
LMLPTAAMSCANDVLMKGSRRSLFPLDLPT